MSIEHSTAAFYSRHFVILIFPGKWCNEEGLILGSMAFSKHAIKTQKSGCVSLTIGDARNSKRLHACRSKSFLQTKYTKFFLFLAITLDVKNIKIHI